MIGQTVFTTDGNETREWTIEAETPRKWIAVDRDEFGERRWSFMKSGGGVREAIREDFRRLRMTVYMTAEALSAARLARQQSEWVSEHAWRIAKVVDHCRDYDTLRKVAELVGYKEEAK